MNIQELRQSLKLKWLSYYHQNRSWLEKMRVWGTYDGERRPFSGFILATLSTLEPQLEEILPLLAELNNNPDDIIRSLGLNFNPEEHLDLLECDNSKSGKQHNNESPSEDVSNHQASVQDTVTALVPSNGKSVLPIAVATEEVYQSPNTSISDKPATEKSDYPHPLTPSPSGEKGNKLLKLPSPEVGEALGVRVKKGDMLPSPPFTITTQVENKSVLPNGVVTQVDNQQVCSPPISFTLERDSKTKLSLRVNRNSMITQVSTILPQVESKKKLQSTPHKKVPIPVNSSHPNPVSNLANWIDGFCQGVEWEREESVFVF
jgi:hypothetical protein